MMSIATQIKEINQYICTDHVTQMIQKLIKKIIKFNGHPFNYHRFQEIKISWIAFNMVHVGIQFIHFQPIKLQSWPFEMLRY